MKNKFYPLKKLKFTLACLVTFLFISTAAIAQVPTASVTSDSTCLGDPVTLSLDFANGTIQWQSNTGSGWINETGPGSDSISYTVSPMVDTDYRAYITFAGADTTNIVSVFVLILTSPINTTVDSVRCGIGNVTLTASGTGTVLWFESPTSEEFLDTGSTYIPFINGTTTFYASSSTLGITSNSECVLITEVSQFEVGGGAGTPPPFPGTDWIEFTNIGNSSIDISNWKIEVTGGSVGFYTFPGGASIPAQSTVLLSRNTGTDMAGVVYYDNPGTMPTSSSGVANGYILSDNLGNVVDVTATNGFAVVGTGNPMATAMDWDGITTGSSSGTAGIRRAAPEDNNSGSDWTVASTSNLTNWGVVNPTLTLGSCGFCESPRIPITAYSTAPPAVTAVTSPLAVCQTDTVTIDLSSTNPNYIYTWTPATFLDTTAGANVVAIPTATTTYVMIANDTAAACVTSDTFLVDVGIIPSAGTAVAPVDTVCVGATTAISVTSSIGNIQWQIDDGTGWVNATGSGSDSTSYTFMPSVLADYRAIASSGGCPNDTSNVVNIAVINITDPTAFDTIRCGPGPVNMHATGVGEQVWYDSPVGGVKLGTGSIFTINIQDTDTFYVESNIGTLCNAGEADNSIGNTSTFTSTTQNWGLQFSASQPVYLDRVHVYVGNTGGNIVVNLRDAIGGAIINTGTFFVPANVAKFPLDLGWFVPNGTGFALELQANPTVDLVYNFTGATYPINKPGCPVSITGYFNPNLNNFDDYLYFYDWEISDGCKTNRFPAIATVLPLPAQPTISQNANTLSAVDPAPSYQWHLNGIPIAGATSQDYVVTQLGDYQVEIGSANGCTEISNIYTITIISPIGIDEGSEEIDLQVYPNPAKDIFSVAFELEESAKVKISLRNAIGQNVNLMDEIKVRGKYESNLDVSNFADGIYLLEIKIENTSYNRKLIIAR